MARKKKSIAPRKTMLIVTASEAESLYFSQVRKDSRFSNLSVEWAGDGFSDLEKLISYAGRKRNHGRFNEAWLVFSFEQFGLDSAAVKELIPLANKKKVHLAWSNPGISLWYLFHFKPLNSFDIDLNSIDNAIREKLPEFTSDAEYLKTDGIDFYKKICVMDNDANINARAYNDAVEKVLGLPAINFVELSLAITEYCGIANFTQNQRTIGMEK